MSIFVEAQKEMRKLQLQIASDNKKLEALQTILQEYNVTMHPGTKQLYELVIGCLRDHAGHASFGEIIACLETRHVMIPRQKLSIALTKCPDLVYDREKKLWGLKA